MVKQGDNKAAQAVKSRPRTRSASPTGTKVKPDKRRDGGVRLVHEGLWRVDVEVNRDPVTGRRRRVSRQVRGSRQDAELALSRLRILESRASPTDRRHVGSQRSRESSGGSMPTWHHISWSDITGGSHSDRCHRGPPGPRCDLLHRLHPSRREKIAYRPMLDLVDDIAKRCTPTSRSRVVVAVSVGTMQLVHGEGAPPREVVLAGRSRMRSCSSRVGVTRRHPTRMRRSRCLPRRQLESSIVRLCARCRVRRRCGPSVSRGRA